MAEFGGSQGVVPLVQGEGEQLVQFAHEAGDQLRVCGIGVVGDCGVVAAELVNDVLREPAPSSCAVSGKRACHSQCVCGDDGSGTSPSSMLLFRWSASTISQLPMSDWGFPVSGIE